MHYPLARRILPALAALVLLATLWAFAPPNPYPRYAPPLRTTLMTTGTFGELRSNHFHGGVDLRGPVGTPIYSIGDGYVQRISIQAGGFGQALYIAHPEGYTSVYGHLDSFSDSLLAYVRANQYARESFDIDLRPDPSRFPVRRGDLVAYVGNRGASQGPHLHLEIRDTETDDPLNPLSFGLEVADSRKPDLHEIRLYELDQSGNVLDQQTHDLRYTQEDYVPEDGDTLYVEGEWSGIGVKVFDRQDLRHNRNGIYGASLYLDSTLHYGWQMDRFSFAETRYLNAHTDYEAYRFRNGGWFHRLFSLPGNGLPMYQTDADRGRIRLQPGENRRLRVVTFDYAGNERACTFVLARRPGASTLVNHHYNYYLPQGEASRIETPELQLHFADDALYEDTYLEYHAAPDGSEDIYSAVHQIHTPTTPVHRYFQIAIRPDERLPQDLRDRAVLARCSGSRTPISFGGTWEDGFLRSEVRDFGDYCILIDTVPPSIRPSSFRYNLRGRGSFSFRIGDNFPTSGPARGLRYRAEVDGKWLLMEYDLKSNRIFHNFDGSLPRGVHTLTIEVTDDRENTARWEGKFRV